MTSFLPSTILLALSLTALPTFSDEMNGAHRVETVTNLHFYFHDTVTGKQPSAIVVAGQKDAFGMTRIIDDPLTKESDPGSEEVGRAQGAYTMSSKDGAALLMMMSFVFEEGRYNRSSISILGSNRFLEAVREMPIVGGTGAFRFARGYALAKTVKFDRETGDAVVEYNVFVMHH